MNLKQQICIVDDEPAHRMLTKRVALKSIPELSVIEASSLSEVAAILKTHPAFSIFILDLNVKGVRSIEILKELQTHSPKSALLMVSTSTLESDIFDSYACGAHCYLFKSDNPADYQHDLAHALQFLLRSHP